MRILSFSKKWDKLSKPEFTTFRITRRDKDWYVPELVQVVIKTRSKERQPLGIAEISQKNITCLKDITEIEAMADGFDSAFAMWLWMKEAHKGIAPTTPLNKLTISWIRR